MSSYRQWIERASKKRGTDIVLALDLETETSKELLSRGSALIEKLEPYICAVKVNFQLLLPLGLDKVRELLNLSHNLDLPAIMDCKLSDVGHMNRVIASNYFGAGFDAMIVSPLIGWEEGVKPVSELASSMGKGVLLLVYMSHKGAVEGFERVVIDSEDRGREPQYHLFARKAREWNADGVIVGATYPDKVKQVSTILGGKTPIYSPGIGTQGGSVESALGAGSRYLIVGRTLTSVESPEKEAEGLVEHCRRAARLQT